MMRGIILAGGSGTRLYPLTQVASKQLLPVYDKPMIYYPLSTLMLFGIKDVLIISTKQDIPNIKKLFGTGERLGLNIQYAVQERPDGIAQAFLIGADFIGDSDVGLILGDNIFYVGEQLRDLRDQSQKDRGYKATIFSSRVSDPERFGVIEFDKDLNVISIEEKPKQPKSNYASVGLYFYPSDVVEKARSLKPSKRGELEITDINNLYLKEDRLTVVPMKRGNAWLDAGTPKGLMDSSKFVQIIEERQGVKIACIEEVAYKYGFIDDNQMHNIINSLKLNEYKLYLEKVYKEKHELY